MADMLVTVSELEAVMQQTLTAAAATLAIEIASGVVQAAAGQRLIQVVGDQVVIDLDALDCGPYLYLPEGPVTAVTSAKVGATVVTDWTAELTRARVWRALGWRSWTLGWFDSRAPSTATVVYTHGYPAGDQRLQLARGVVFELAKTGYSTATGSGAVLREQIDDYAVQYAQMAASIESALDPAGAMARALRRMYGLPRRSAYLINSGFC